MTLSFSAPLSCSYHSRQNSHQICRRRPLSPKMVLENPPSADPLASTLHHLHLSPVVLCIRLSDPDLALQAATAALRGGLRSIEVTLTTPSAFSLIRHLSRAFPDALIGAGTVLTPAELRNADSAGARFCLSPISDPVLVQQATRRGMLTIPGAATPTEIHNAYQAGAKVVKVFPVNAYGGLDFVKAMAGPLGHIPLLPTSGVDLKSLPHYLSLSNVHAVGASRQILQKDALRNKDWDAIAERAMEWTVVASEYRPKELLG